MSLEERRGGNDGRALKAAGRNPHHWRVQRHTALGHYRGKTRNADVMTALPVGHLDHGQVGRGGAMPAARRARNVIVRLLVLLVLPVVKMENMETAACGITSEMGMGEWRHALQECENQQKRQASYTSHFHPKAVFSRV